MALPQQKLSVDDVLKHAVELIKHERWQESLALHYRLIELRPTLPAAYYGLGVTQFKLGEHRSAALSFGTCLRLDPGHANAQFYLGEISFAENQIEAARRHFQTAIQLFSFGLVWHMKLLSTIRRGRSRRFRFSDASDYEMMPLMNG